MLGASTREFVLPGADGHCPDSAGGNCQGETRIGRATNVARVVCPLVAVGGCGAKSAEAPALVSQNPSEVQ